MRVFFSIQVLEVKKIQFDTDFGPDEIDFDDHSVRQVGNLHAEGTAELLSNTLGEVRVYGTLQVEMEADCDRCLEATRFPLKSSFDLFYRPVVEEANPHHSEVEIDKGEAEMGFYEGAGIELTDVLREQVLLALPMQLVCSETCRGICPLCGKNRNLGVCHCESKPADDRWAALKEISNSPN